MKEHKFGVETFIGGYYIDTDLCDKIKLYFDSNIQYASLGTVTLNTNRNHVNKKMKDSLDLSLLSNKKLAQDYGLQLNKVLKKYQNKFKFVKKINTSSIKEDLKIQYYKKSAGYKTWHFERAGLFNTTRSLVFMTYLNNVPKGGTEFYYQKITAPAKKGLTLIWPTDWTHTHRGQITKKYNKYIVTGWLNFNY
jgi:hypothetical protein|tara:strand:+ start:76 stop:654 length:579 start_codon:yes stop_codon:yes gene_type:complete